MKLRREDAMQSVRWTLLRMVHRGDWCVCSPSDGDSYQDVTRGDFNARKRVLHFKCHYAVSCGAVLTLHQQCVDY